MATPIGMKRTAKKKPLNKVSKKPKRILIKKLDIVFSKYIRADAGNKCIFGKIAHKFVKDMDEFKDNYQPICLRESKYATNNHHGVVHRRYMNTRFEEDNCISVCVGCHNFLGDFPEINTDLFKALIGADRMHELERMALSGKKVTTDQLEELLEKYTKAIKEL